MMSSSLGAHGGVDDVFLGGLVHRSIMRKSSNGSLVAFPGVPRNVANKGLTGWCWTVKRSTTSSVP